MSITNIKQAITFIHSCVTKNEGAENVDIDKLEIALKVINENNKNIQKDTKNQIIGALEKLSKLTINKKNQILQQKIKKSQEVLLQGVKTSAAVVDMKTKTGDPHTNKLQEKVEKVISLQSLFRMYLTHSKIILPKELSPFLKKNLKGLNDVELEAVSKIIARESVNMLRDPKAYKNEGIRLSKTKVTCKDGNQKVHILPRTLWLNLSNDEKTIRVQFYGKRKLAEGTFKKVKKSQTIEITLSDGAEKPKRKEKTVLIRSKDSTKDLNDMKGRIETILKLFTLEEIRKNPQLKLAGIPKIIRTHRGKTRKKLEWEEIRFASDLFDVCKTNTVKIGSKKSDEEQFRTGDRLRMIESLFYTLDKIHQKGKVHRDVKPHNVLMLYNKDKKRLEGYLTDYDTISDFGKNSTEETYCYWDRCSEAGIVLPTTDIFGLAACLADSMFGAIVSYHLGVNRRKYGLKIVLKNIKSYQRNFINNINEQLLNKITITEELKKQIEDLIYLSCNDDDTLSFTNLEKIFNEDSTSEKVIKNYIAESNASKQVATLLTEIYKADKKLYKFMETENGKTIRKSLSNKNIPLEDKLEIIKKQIYNKFPIFRDFGAKVKQIRKDWQSTMNNPLPWRNKG